jgi:hypothetical protein
MYYCASYELFAKADAVVRFVNIEKTRAGRPRGLASYLLRRRGDQVALVPVDQLGSACFGSLGTPDELALNGFIAGKGASGCGRPLERPHRDGTDATG